MVSFLLLYLGFFNTSRCQVSELLAILSPLQRAPLTEQQSLYSKEIKTFKICNIIKQILESFSLNMAIFISVVFQTSHGFSAKTYREIRVSSHFFFLQEYGQLPVTLREAYHLFWNIILKFYHKTRPVPFYSWIK